ncbi:hypothetical protein [Cecembia sp.]|uniref:hypothetical protein n=1 Tax=Cecembia sp. TaxID=1898110 RepID=UPI0025BFFA42|nr:hypothetical protein [Cecembia sp.]
MKKIILILLLLNLIQPLSGQQDWGNPILIEFPRLSQLSVDNQGFIFIADTEGNIYQYDQRGKEINNFSPNRQAAISHLEAAWTVNIFTFSADLQEYRILDRFINPVSENRIPLEHFNVVKIATLGNNNIIWAFDETDLSLKQWDYRRNRIFQNQPLNLIFNKSSFEIRDMREYQNLLFLSIEDEGIYILDNQGNFIKNIPKEITQRLSFLESNLIFNELGKLKLLNYQSGQENVFSLPDELLNYHVIANRYQLIFYNDRRVMIYPLEQSPLKDIKKQP